MVERSIFGPKINIWQKRIFPKPPYFILHNFSCMVISASTFRPVIITIRFKWKIIYPFKISAQAGIQAPRKPLKRLDSRFHGNDGKANLRTFYESIKTKAINNYKVFFCVLISVLLRPNMVSMPLVEISDSAEFP